MHVAAVSAQLAMSHDQLRWSWRSTCPTTVRWWQHRAKLKLGLAFVRGGTHRTTPAIAARSWRPLIGGSRDWFQPFDPVVQPVDQSW